MDVQAANLLATLRRTSSPPEQKLTLLSNLKSDIKHYRVPDNAQATIFECLKLAISQQTSINIVTAALSTLGHLVKRLKIQDAEGRSITTLAPRLWPCLQDRLGDPRESHRTGALQAFVDLHPFCIGDVEHIIREDAIICGSVRTKEMGMQWVVLMHTEQGLPFKSFVPAMVACLEDAEGQVRDAAKAAIVDLFRPASTPAKNDLKKQLKLHNVRQSITAQILAQIGATERTAPPTEVDFAASTRSLPAFDHAAQFAQSISSEEAKPPPAEEVQMDPIFVHSLRELEDMFRDMAPHFEGRESEENWLHRDRDITKLRRITKGNAPSEYHAAYMSGLKHMQEGTLKAANTLRTTMMTNGCLLVQELARNLGPAMDSMVESYVQNFIKMCAATKNIQAQNGNQTVDTIFQYVSYNVRLSQHIWNASQDKNKAPRVFASGWLRTVLGRQAGSKTHFEHTGGLELAEKTIKKGLTDADPKVKESMRATYWAFAKLWPERGGAIMNALDDKAKAALERDSHNPNASNSQSSFAASTTSRTSGARSALRDRIAAAKREKAQPPARPVTAMASMSPSKSKSMANLGARAKAMGPPSVSRTVSNASITSTATTDSISSTTSTATTRPLSLMSGAARRPVKRPELARPATADPYASRKVLRPETPSDRSPIRSPRQSTTSRTPAAQSTIARNRVSRQGSPAATPLRNPRGPRSESASRPSSKDAGDGGSDVSGHMNMDDLTMVLPSAASRETLSSAARKRPPLETSHSVDTGIHGLGIDDNFTLVMPSSHSAHASMSDRPPSAFRSPVRRISEEGSHIPQPKSARQSMRLGSPTAQAKSPSSRPSASPRNLTPDRRSASVDDLHTKAMSRQGSPLKSHTSAPIEEEEVKIYEDPFTASQSPNGHHNGVQPPTVLTELPVNENSPPTTADPANPAAGNFPTGEQPSMPPPKTLTETPLSPPQSPQSKAEKLRSRKLLQSGISRIRARTLDTHGYRKVLDLTRTNVPEDLFGLADEDAGVARLYEDLFSALLSFISTAPGTTPVPDRPTMGKGSSSEVKRQAFSLLRYLLKRQDGPVVSWNLSINAWQRALEATLQSKKFVDGAALVGKDIETLISEARVHLSSAALLDTATAFLATQVEAGQSKGAYDWPPSTTSSSPADAVNGQAREDKASAQASALTLRTVSTTLSSTASTTNGADTNGTNGVNGHAPSEPTAQHRTSIAHLLSSLLRATDAETRKAATECATELYSVWPAPHVNGETNGNGMHVDGEERRRGSMGAVSKAVREKEGFWDALDGGEGLPESTKNLIVYFIARREGRFEGR